MNWLRRLYRSTQRSATSPRRPSRARLYLEGLETRLTPASVLVVPISAAADIGHFHTLAQAIAAAGTNGTVTVEPGASPDAVEPVLVNLNGLTIQGDPNTPASILPGYQLHVVAHNVTLTNLNLASVKIGNSTNGDGSFFQNTISKCAVGSLTDLGVNSTFTQNTFTGPVTITGNSQTTQGDLISNNSFSSTAPVLLQIQFGFGTQVTNNTFFGDGAFVGVQLLNCNGNPPGPTTVAHNTISLLGNSGDTPVGVEADQTAIGLLSFVEIDFNNINTHGTGKGVVFSMVQGGNSTGNVNGNDFHNNAVGVFILGDGKTGIGSAAHIALSGNNFRSFAPPASAQSAAISLQSAPTTNVVAEHNLFTGDPTKVVFTDSGTIDTTNPITSNAAFVQALYIQVLGRSPSSNESSFWINVFNRQGQAAVVHGILFADEALGRIVDGFYLRFLGRQSDANGRAGWISFLQHGGTEEQLENLFLTSPEYINHINTDFVQSLYLNILGRSGDTGGLSFWNNNIQALGLQGIAKGFTGSAENRQNTLATYFQTFLHRAPMAGELTPLVNSSQDLLGLEATVLSTPEFFTKG